ncbi:hypothetical protein ACHAWF_004456 [Thalassiosira exigua]
MAEDHYLDSYLSKVLPALGLDAETYAPYVTGYANDNDDDDGESLDDLIELLRASSESHGEDDAAWENLRKEIIHRRQEYLSGEYARKVKSDLFPPAPAHGIFGISAIHHTDHAKDIELAHQNALEVEARKQMDLEANKLENMSGDKIAMMAKYGYEEGNTDDETGNPEKSMSNQDHAAALSQKNAQTQRSAPLQTKKEARQETAKAKADKNAKKEERRKKAGKKERRR